MTTSTLKNYVMIGFMACSLSALAQTEEPLFKLNGKTYTAEGFSPDLKQAWFEVQEQQFEHVKKIIDSAILDEHIAQLAKKENKSKEQIRAKIIKTPKITEKEAKAWFEENKMRLGGRTFDSIKEQIMQLLAGQGMEEAERSVIEELKKERAI